MTIYNSCKYDSMVMGDWRSRLNLTHPCILKIEVEKKRTKKNLCWAVDLPCTLRLSQDNIKLRNPKRGIRARFIKY